MKSITKNDLLNLWMSGVANITVHTLSVEHSYKVFKFKKKIKALFEELKDSDKGILETLNIPDEQAFRARLAELKADAPTEAEKAELAEKKDLCDKLDAMRKKLYEEKIDLEEIKALPYEDWRKLQDENKAVSVEIEGRRLVVDIFSGYLEEILENILWVAPVENEK